MQESIDQPRFRASLISIFAGLALILAAVGLYGLIKLYGHAADARDRHSRRRARRHGRCCCRSCGRAWRRASGIAIGLVGAVAAARALSAFLFGVEATDPATFASVALLLLVVAVAASYLPSRRALKVDPVIALRAE